MMQRVKYKMVQINDYVYVLLRIDAPVCSRDAHVIVKNCIDEVDLVGCYEDCKEVLHDMLHAARYYDRRFL